MPVNAEPTPDGNVQLVDRQGTVIANVLAGDDLERVRAQPGAKLRLPHHSTCPQADSWRKSR
jgi:hypothetical protein